MTFILMRLEHNASYQRVLPIPAFAYPVRKRLTKKGPDPYEEDVDMKELRKCGMRPVDYGPDSTTPVPDRPPEVMGTT